MKQLTFLFTLVLAGACATQPANKGNAVAQPTTQTEAAEAIPLEVDPDVRVGKLDNGLTYYIRHHEQPRDRAMLWLAVDAGSVLEDDDQRGLAHFVEHMAFNGTERFEKNTLIDFIERAGMDFGADLNAFTSFDETVYMLTVPTDDDKLVTMGMDILEDWSGALTFDAKEVDKERGVVVEEWRLGRGASQRAFDKQWPIFLQGSKYADRKPIGEKQILENAPVERLQSFYEDWYRPDLMAVIVVGDVDPDAMQKEIERRFGDLKGPEKPRPRDNVPVPLLDETRAAVVTDPETQVATVSLVIKGPLTPIETEKDYRDALIEHLFESMLDARLDEIARDPEAPFVFGFTFTSEMGRAVDVFRMMAGAKPGKVDETLKTLTVELERVRRHGFLTSELKRQKAELMRELERRAAEKDKEESRAYAFEIVNHFLEGQGMPGRDKELELGKKFLAGIELDEVNGLASTWTTRKDRVVMASGPARDEMPEQKELLAIVSSASKLKIDPYQEESSAESLMAKAPEPGSITNKETIERLGVSVWTLSNGARVIVKPTDFKNDEVLMTAFSPGGHSLAPTKDYRAASLADSIVMQGGVGSFDANALQKMLAGKMVRVNPWISELEEGFEGSASPKDLETMLQLVHLYATQPRRDEKAFKAFKSSMATFVKNRDLNPTTYFFERLQAFAHDNHPRRLPLTMEELDKVDLDTAFEFYEDRFADAGDFTFVFVGNVESSRLETLVATYLASLPANGRKEKWKDVGIKYPRGTKKFEVKKGQDPKSFVWMSFHGTTKWTPEAEDDIEMLAEVLGIRLREVLREDMGGVYGAFSHGEIERRPKQRYTYSIGFGCAPDNVGKLQRAVLEIATSLKKSGIGDDYLDKIREQRRRALQTERETNGFWQDKLAEHYRYGTDPRKILELEQKAVERVNSKNVQAAARRYLGRQHVDGILMPEATKVKPKAATKAAASG